MNADQETSVLSAAKHLKIKDVVLANARFERPAQDAPAAESQIRQEHKRGVEYLVSEAEFDGKQERLLQVSVQLGMRFVEDAAEAAEAAIYLLIEAEYVVIYQITEEIDESAIASFADFNAVHNVWPFWRQHVFDIVQRGRLPQIEIPLFSGIKL